MGGLTGEVVLMTSCKRLATISSFDFAKYPSTLFSRNIELTLSRDIPLNLDSCTIRRPKWLARS